MVDLQKIYRNVHVLAVSLRASVSLDATLSATWRCAGGGVVGSIDLHEICMRQVAAFAVGPRGRVLG